MRISANMVVLFDFQLKDDDGQPIESSADGEPIAYLHGSGEVVPGLEAALEGREAGDSFQVTVSPEDGFGERSEELCQDISKEEFTDIDDLAVGMQFRVPTDDGETVVTVTEIGNDFVSIDGNHELAGCTLHFDVQIREVRAATPEEIEHGHAHGVGGHHHDHDHG